MNAIKGLVFGMGALIVLLTTLIGYGLYQKATNPDFKFFSKDEPQAEEPAVPSAPHAAAPTARVVFGERLLGGGRIVSSQVDGGRLILTLAPKDGDADRVVILDLATGATLGTVRLAQ